MAYCSKCGKEIVGDGSFCSRCGEQVGEDQNNVRTSAGSSAKIKQTLTAATQAAISPKEKGIVILLSILIGFLGIDRFYRGQIGLGVLKLITFGGCCLWAFIDTLVYLLGALPVDGDNKPILDRQTMDLGTNGINQQDLSSKDKDILILLSGFLGCFGIDRFYRGHIGLGILKLITFGGCGIWAFIETIVYVMGNLPTDGNGKIIADQKTIRYLNSNQPA